MLYRVLSEQGELSDDTQWMLECIRKGQPLDGDDQATAWLRELRRRLDPRGAT